MSELNVKEANQLLERMLKHAVHFGHSREKWNPKMRDFIYSVRENIHVFDLHQTMVYLVDALNYLKTLSRDGKTVLFVSTKQQAIPIVKATAEGTGQPYVTNKWIPGLLTNYDTVSKRIRHLKRLKEMQATGEMGMYTKKEQSQFAKEIQKLEDALGGVSAMNKLPDALLVLDTVRDRVAVLEARKKGIPVIGVCDSNADPDLVDYMIPGNDDAIKAIEFYFDEFAAALKK
ncbi:30S ribosomal protein S2 [Candidatus Gracilibacteria bacterium]|jgi:small subunit ribosomal protein S2|nr:30S ribosomal protein S2 [Candidatus Gracilibacteria bacterium]